ncbi:MAG TPA: MFS transporter [Verrucomicrobiae bacterium]|nr:MFS transporter [Verrucomicrobiae bacterium]
MPDANLKTTGSGEPVIHSAAQSSAIAAGYFVLEGLNTCGATYYSYYIFFYLQKHFGFGNVGNLTFAALNGFTYIFSAWYGGKFAQKRGYHTALVFGFCTSIVMLLFGSRTNSVTGQVIVMVLWTIGICFTWPSLEALVAERRGPRELPRMIGIYNLVWSGAGAVTYFCGGAIFERLGEKSLFLLPASIHAFQLLILAWIWKTSASRQHLTETGRSGLPLPKGEGRGEGEQDLPSSQSFPLPDQLLIPPLSAKAATPTARAFLRMAWLSNPFAYIAINTIVAVIPQIAARFNFSPMFAGFFCSIWLFVRMGTFLLLWHWPAWHYRFRWLVSAFIGLVVSFTFLLLVPNLFVLIASQVVFGLSIGLIYYSSLFYSMDVGETKGEHGGIHEAAIGLGIFLGPAVGATALRLLPQFPNSGAWAVSGLLTVGLGLLLLARRKRGANSTVPSGLG